ncbi:MAG: ribose-phosphate diphosphokinase [Armatimonadetes bacterium]|nr:MAG: ribose-phosphate diphosphokinase [Armatimonadota bacterium]
MQRPGLKRMLVFSGSANVELAEEVCKLLDVELGGVERSRFADGEIYIRFTESVRGADCFVIQSHSKPINEHIMEQLIMIDALKRASAKRITAVVPFYGYARQDKKGRPREPITARMMGDLFIAAGADRIAAVDLHTGQVQGFIDAPFDSLTALPLFTDYLKNKEDGPLTVVSPDSGGVKRATRFAHHLNAEVAFIYKRRRTDARNQVTASHVVGDVKDRHCIIVDDIIDTAGTVVAGAELLLARGAASVKVLATHGVLSGPATERLRSAAFSEIVITNTLPVSAEALSLPNLTVLSIAPIVAGTIEAIFNDSSVSEIFKGENT